jgi:hypothetical protein
LLKPLASFISLLVAFLLGSTGFMTVLLSGDFDRLDPDPRGQKLPRKKGKVKKFMFEVLDFLFSRLRLLLKLGQWTSFMET